MLQTFIIGLCVWWSISIVFCIIGYLLFLCFDRIRSLRTPADRLDHFDDVIAAIEDLETATNSTIDDFGSRRPKLKVELEVSDHPDPPIIRRIIVKPWTPD